jgi:predicted phage tail protein
MKTNGKFMTRIIRGSKGGGKGGGGGATRTAQEAPNTLRSKAIARVIDLISEGEIIGLVDGAKSIFFNDTPLQNADGSYNFAGVSYDFRLGTPTQTHMPGFPGTEAVTVVETEVLNATPVIRTVADTDVDAVRVTMRLPQLFSQNTSNGDVNGSSVSIAIDIKTSGAPDGTYVNKVTDTITGKTNSPYERSYRIELAGVTGPWDIRFRRITADSVSSALQDKTFWGNLVTIIDNKVSYMDSAVFGVQVDAQTFAGQVPTRAYDIKGRILQVPSNYDPVTRIYTGIWDGTFQLAWTDNPAWVFYDLLTHERYGLGEFIQADAIDKWALYAIAQYCDELVDDGFGGTEPRFTFNGILNSQQDAIHTLQAIASAFRGMSYWSSGAVTATQDSPADATRLVTPSNVVGGEISYKGTSLRDRHTVALVSWNDPNDGFKPAIEVVENRAGIQRYGYRPLDVMAVGCTSRGQAARYGRWILDSEINETEMASYTAGMDHGACRPGEIIAIADPTVAGVRFGGRLVAGSTATKLMIDAAIELISPNTYTASLILPNGLMVDKQVISAFGTTDELDLVSAIVAHSGDAQAGGASSLTLATTAGGVPLESFITGQTLKLTAGAGSVQERTISAYDGATKIATVAQRWSTNMAHFSSTWSDAYWVKSAVLTASGDWWNLNDDNAVAWESMVKGGFAADLATDYILSVRIKKEVAPLTYYPVLRLRFSGGTAGNFDVALDPFAGTVVKKFGVAGTVGVVDDGDAWRIYIIANSTDNNVANIEFYPAAGLMPLTEGSAYSNTAVGDIDANDIQLEKASDLSDYIETQGAAITVPNATTDYELITAPPAGTVWVVTGTDVASRKFRVITSREQEKGTQFNVLALLHDENKYARVEQNLILDPLVFSRLSAGAVLPPRNLAFEESLYIVNNTVQTRINLTWQPSLDTRVVSYEVSARAPNNNNWVTLGTTSTQDFDILSAEPGAWSFRVAAVSAIGKSKPIELLDQEIFGKTAAPSDVTGFTFGFEGPNTLLHWDAVEDLDIGDYEIRQGADWDSGVLVGRSKSTILLTAAVNTPTQYWIKAVDTSGIYSDNAATTTVIPVAPESVASTLAAVFDGADLKLTWTTPDTSYSIRHYIVRYGDTFAGGTEIGRVDVTTFRALAEWAGVRRWWVAAVDVGGNQGTAASIDVTVTIPTQPVVIAEVIDNNVLMRWDDVEETLPILHYEIRRGDLFATADVIGTISARFSVVFESSGGTYRYWVVGVDAAGNYGTEGSISTTVNTPPDYVLFENLVSEFTGTKTNTRGVTRETFLKLPGIAGNEASTPDSVAASVTGDIEFVCYVKPTDWAPAAATAVFSKSDAASTRSYGLRILTTGQLNLWFSTDGTLFQSTSSTVAPSIADGTGAWVKCNRVASTGVCNFYIAHTSPDALPGDSDWVQIGSANVAGTAGNIFDSTSTIKIGVRLGTERFIGEIHRVVVRNGIGGPAVVDFHPWLTHDGDTSFVAATGETWTVATSGTDIARITSRSQQLLAIFDPTRTFQQHFTDEAWDQPQDQVTAGFPIYIQPGTTTGQYAEEVDYGSVLPATKITVDMATTLVSGAITVTPTISIKLNAGDPWTDFVGQWSVFATNFRYFKVTLDFAAAGRDDLLYIDTLNYRLDVKLRSDAGTVSCLSTDVGGTEAFFNVDFIDVQSITATAQGTTALIVVIDFTDAPNPTSFRIYVYNTAGVRQSATVRWEAKGV